MSACTLTDDAFEPSPVDSVGGGLTPAATNEPSPPAEVDPALAAGDGSESGRGGDGAAGGGPSSEAGEPGLASIALDPSEAESGEPGTDGEGGDDTPGERDAGADPSPGEAPPGADMAPEAPVTAACPGMPFDGSCYQVFGELAAWNVAVQRCSEWGGHLASVESIEEDTFLDAWPAQLGVPFANGSGIWLGGTDAAVEGDFRWLDESPLSFEGWAPNQPDNGAGIDCIEKRNDGTALWYDRRCSDVMPFICERPL
jgi:collectin sub-family protein 12